MPWVPKPDNNTTNPVQIPQCWVECDGRPITEGIWEGLVTPDLNNAQRFLRGGTQANVLEEQDDALQDHTHYLNDPGLVIHTRLKKKGLHKIVIVLLVQVAFHGLYYGKKILESHQNLPLASQ